MEYDISRAVDRALTLLETMSCSDSPIGIRELARSLGYPSSATQRLLATLQLHGYVQKDPASEKYSLGTKVLSLSSRLLERLDFRRVAIPIMRGVRDRCGEIVILFIADGAERVCIESVQSNHHLRWVATVGTRLPIHAGAAGKVLLAYYAPDQLEAVLSNGLDRITEFTITDPNLMQQELKTIRSQGWARAIGEGFLDHASVAVPIWGGVPPRVVAAMSVHVAAAHFTPEREQHLIALMQEAGSKVSTMLGAVAPPALETSIETASSPSSHG